MSIRDERNQKFLSLKSLLRKDNTFSFYVLGPARKMTTKFGEGWYLLGQNIQKGKEKQLKGLLKVSPTTIGTIGDVFDGEHLDDLEGKIVDFEFDDNIRTIKAVAVREWSD